MGAPLSAAELAAAMVLAPERVFEPQHSVAPEQVLELFSEQERVAVVAQQVEVRVVVPVAPGAAPVQAAAAAPPRRASSVH